MTKNIPWIKEYPTDELKEIATLSLLERGAYFSLKLIYHTNPDAFKNEQILFAMCLAFSGDERTAVQTVVERLFKQGEILPFSARLNELENKALVGINQKKLAGIKSGQARRAKRTAVRTISESNLESKSESESNLESKSESNLKSEIKIDDFRKDNFDIDLYLDDDDRGVENIHAPGWDKHLLRTNFNNWIKAPTQKIPTKPVNAYLTWLQKTKKGQPPR